MVVVSPDFTDGKGNPLDGSLDKWENFRIAAKNTKNKDKRQEKKRDYLNKPVLFHNNLLSQLKIKNFKEHLTFFTN